MKHIPRLSHTRILGICAFSDKEIGYAGFHGTCVNQAGSEAAAEHTQRLNGMAGLEMALLSMHISIRNGHPSGQSVSVE
jgi:hypothetical protein